MFNVKCIATNKDVPPHVRVRACLAIVRPETAEAFQRWCAGRCYTYPDSHEARTTKNPARASWIAARAAALRSLYSFCMLAARPSVYAAYDMKKAHEACTEEYEAQCEWFYERAKEEGIQHV